MVQRVIYFDLDGTLWSADAKRFPCMQTAWDRLPKAVEQYGLKLPEDFDWSKQAGSTDLDVVLGIVSQISPGRGEWENKQKATKIITLMDEYYEKNQLQSISEAVFSDTVPGLKSLKAMGYKLGIVTGNSQRVTKVKLKAAGLTEFFDDEKLIFCGDERENRWELLDRAHIQTLILNSGERFMEPLIYVADTLRDLGEGIEMWRQKHGFNKEVRILLRAGGLGDRDWPSLPTIDRQRFRVQVFRQIADADFGRFVDEEAWVTSFDEQQAEKNRSARLAGERR